MIIKRFFKVKSNKIVIFVTFYKNLHTQLQSRLRPKVAAPPAPALAPAPAPQHCIKEPELEQGPLQNYLKLVLAKLT
jgi:hypothetical protein